MERQIEGLAKDWRLEKLDDGNVLFFKGKNYVPKDNEL